MLAKFQTLNSWLILYDLRQVYEVGALETISSGRTEVWVELKHLTNELSAIFVNAWEKLNKVWFGSLRKTT
jgi:hypothetical protein